MAAKESRDKETFGERLRRLRKAHGFTQVELAQAIGVSQPTVAYYENEDGVPGGVLILKLAQVLDIAVEELLGTRAAGRRVAPDSPNNLRLWRKLKQVEKLSAAERRQIVQMIDALVERSELKREQAF